VSDQDEGPVMDWGAHCSKAHVGRVGECLACSRDEARARLAEAERLIDRQHDALTQIIRWSEAYPLDVFPEPDFKAVNLALKAAGLSLDQVSASNMRHVISRVGEIARAADSAEAIE
jgi:hypothetical protein